MATQRTACSDESPGKPGVKRAKHARVTATSTTVQSTTTCAEEVCKIVGSGDGLPENAEESSKIETSKQGEVIEPGEEAVEVVNKRFTVTSPPVNSPPRVISYCFGDSTHCY